MSDIKDIMQMLDSEGDDLKELFAYASKIKSETIGKVTYLRGLIEYSNICSKDCFYCGIRCSNKGAKRYVLSNEEVISAARFAYENNYGSVVLQAGEILSIDHIKTIEHLIKEIKKLSSDKLGITLSLGEQSEDTYLRWFDAGAHRYLLRIETSNPELYKKLHPSNHKFSDRISALDRLKKTGYQVGSGVMIGLPEQTVNDLANDLYFLKNLDIDMCGMGPYLEHENTPLYSKKSMLWTLDRRFEMTIKMIASLRVLMQDVNIAATTALQAIDPRGREKAISVGANVLMPNITPGAHRDDYNLYRNKPSWGDNAEQINENILQMVSSAGDTIGLGEWGDSKHFSKRSNIKL